ncbi:MAG: sulfatase-like hydrolase/transferase [Candidatus Latescibacterota bacterium]|nr:sulfatase-like hydrolase/transferase [Candidatus Latescibacterota bacterium]
MSKRPNLLFIMPDQLRHDFLSCYGADFIDTPHIDSLAASGTLYERAYSPSPICVPARCTLLTGRNAIKNGVLGNQHFLRPDLAETGIRTWANILSDADYFTASIGKMHFYPWEASFGFEHRVICEDKRWLYIEDDYYRYLEAMGHRKYHGNEHKGYRENRGAYVNRLASEHSWDGFVGTEATKFIVEYDDDRPFAAMIGFPGPHCPYDPSPDYVDRFRAADMPAAAPYVEDFDTELRAGNITGNRGSWNDVDYSKFTDAQKAGVRAHYAGLVKQIDDQVGAILTALSETGRLDNTIVIFSSDHGDLLGDHDLIGKGNYYEGSCHVPMLVRMPGGHSFRSQHVVSLEDVTATLLACAGIERPAYYDSVPLPGLGLDTTRRQRVYGFVTGATMNCDGRHKLVKYRSGRQQLFDVIADPHEQTDLSDTDAGWELARRLDGELTGQLLRSVEEANSERVIAHVPLWDCAEFGRGDWQRTYPMSLEGE